MRKVPGVMGPQGPGNRILFAECRETESRVRIRLSGERRGTLSPSPTSRISLLHPLLEQLRGQGTTARSCNCSGMICGPLGFLEVFANVNLLSEDRRGVSVYIWRLTGPAMLYTECNRGQMSTPRGNRTVLAAVVAFPF